MEKECLAIKLGVETFREYRSNGPPFACVVEQCEGKEWSLVSMEFGSTSIRIYKFNVEHRAGTANGNAYALSRAATDVTTSSSVAGEGGRSVKQQGLVCCGDDWYS